jgi:hypothetical protein
VTDQKGDPMYNRQRVWLWLAAAVSFVVGFILVLSDSSAGWFLIIMGTVYIGALTRPGQGLAASNPGLVRWGLVGVTLLLVLLAVVVGAVLLFK